MLRICINCNLEKEHHGKGYCYNCYKKIAWQRKKFICKRCKRLIFLHSKGLCGGCYNFVFHLDRTKELNYKKSHNIDFKNYKKLTKKCIICAFSNIVELHHLDENCKNNSEENMVGLCPNHHKMVHQYKFRKQMRDLLEEKGFILPKDDKLDFELNRQTLTS